jgi:hypothetical protein
MALQLMNGPGEEHSLEVGEKKEKFYSGMNFKDNYK